MIWSWQDKYRNSPNAIEIGKVVKRRKVSVGQALLRLQRKGYIDIIRVILRPLIVPLKRESD